MSTYVRLVTHTSIAAVLSIGLIALSTQTAPVTNRSVEMKLIPIKEHGAHRNVQSVNEPDTVAHK